MNEENKVEEVIEDVEVDAENVEWEMESEAFDLTELMEEMKSKVEEAENKMYRIQADFDNYRRRIQQEKEAQNKYRAQDLITEILPVLDSFERAMIVEESDKKIEGFLQGIQMVKRQLVEALEKEGLEIIPAVGEPFDPNYHQAIMTVEDESAEPNTVVEEFQKGYKLKDRVIRPTMVKVNQ